MAFSFRKIISNIGYFKTTNENEASENHEQDTTESRDESASSKKRRYSSYKESDEAVKEPVLKLTPTKSHNSIKASPDTPINIEPQLTSTTKKIRLEFSDEEGDIVESTPKGPDLHITNENQVEEINLCKQFKKSLESLHLFTEEDDIKSLSDSSESEISINSNQDVISKSSTRYKLCRKVSNESQILFDTLDSENFQGSSSLGSFSDIELDTKDQGRISLIISYQMKLDKMEQALRRLLTEFKFHIEETKLFSCKSFLTTLPGTDVSNLPRILGDITNIDNVQASESGTWNLVLENQDTVSKNQFKKQLNNMGGLIKKFTATYLDTSTSNQVRIEKLNYSKKLRINRKKRERKLADFPDLREVMTNLFSLEDGSSQHIKAIVDTKVVSNKGDLDSSSKCSDCARFLQMNSSPKSSDSTFNSKVPSNYVSYADTIASSLADFTLNNSDMTIYTESLDNILSFNSYNEESLYGSILEKTVMDRIAFYMQVHKIQITTNNNSVNFNCTVCQTILTDEQGLFKHILSQKHCEKLHFMYKTEYIKKCLQTRSEIKPSTVLNPMTMYRDVNKIVCFGDGAFACTLCFEMLIIGESQAMKHFNSWEHVEKRELLSELFDDNIQ